MILTRVVNLKNLSFLRNGDPLRGGREIFNDERNSNGENKRR